MKDIGQTAQIEIVLRRKLAGDDDSKRESSIRIIIYSRAGICKILFPEMFEKISRFTAADD